jgi:hypothetical protein
MEKLIENVLEEYRHINLHSAAGRQAIVRSIMKKIRSDDSGGFYLNLNSIDGTIPDTGDEKEEAKWVCTICGKSTFHIDYDYIGSDYNHLGCELKNITHNKNDYVYSGDLQKQAYNEMTSDGLPEGGDSQAVLESHKLAEEIVSGKDLGYIFESPDGGKTIYRRKIGESERELVTKDQWKEYNRNR